MLQFRLSQWFRAALQRLADCKAVIRSCYTPSSLSSNRSVEGLGFVKSLKGLGADKF